MAESYRSITPRNLFRDRYVPENDPSWREGQDRFSTNPILGAGERAVDSYRQLKTESAIDVYNFAKANGKSEEEAQDLARQILRGAERTELIASIVAPEAIGAGVGKITSGVGRAVDLAKSLLGGKRAAEPQALLGAPRRNSMFADEMLDVEPTAPSYSGFRRLESGQFLPRIDIPTVKGSGITAKDVTSSPFDEIGRLGGEGGLTDDAVEAARRMAQERLAAEEAFRARQADTMVGEGGVSPGEIARQRALKAAEDAALSARQMGIAEGEGMLTADAVQAAKAMARRRLEAQEAAQAARLDRMTDDGAGMAMTRPMERGSAPVSGNYPVPALRGSTEPASLAGSSSGGGGGGMLPPSSSFDLGGFRLPPPGGNGGGMPPSGGGNNRDTLRMALGAALGADLAAIPIVFNRGIESSRYPEKAGPSSSAPNSIQALDSTLFGEDPGPRPANMRSMDSTLFGEDAGPRPANVRPMDSTLFGESAASRPARAPASPPAASSEQRSGPSSASLWELYNRSMEREGGGDPALFIQASKAMAEGRASGGRTGSNGGGKDAAIHKALEIIHHMLVNR